MSTESPTGITAEFQNHLRSECELKLNETVHTNSINSVEVNNLDDIVNDPPQIIVCETNSSSAQADSLAMNGIENDVVNGSPLKEDLKHLKSPINVCEIDLSSQASSYAVNSAEDVVVDDPPQLKIHEFKKTYLNDPALWDINDSLKDYISIHGIAQDLSQLNISKSKRSYTVNNRGAHFCRGTFDGWLCWDDTEAGGTIHQPCPQFISGFDPTRTAYKICNKDGTWFKHPISGAVWSNYTTCINIDEYNWTQQINNIYQIGYAISFIALLLSIAILTYFKSLRCARNTLHTHMFTSFAINNLLWLLWYRLVVQYPTVVLNNGWWCQILHVVLHYFLLTNYAWMLAEGFYLHTLLVFAFTSEDTLVRWSWTLAWSTPLVVISLYTLLRIIHEHTSECWINESPFTEVLVVPVCMSMALNLVFLCNIVRVLWVKLQAGPSHLSNSTPSRTLLQAFRATLLLLPLLGLHYLLTPFRPPKRHRWEWIYEVVSATTSSFQGLCVATLFCFLNGEVVAQIKRRWQFMFFRTRANSYTATTVSFVRSTAGPGDNEDKV